ncbi:MAG: hypothetical protein ACREVL_16065 [Solimonas sp.]
MNRLANGFPHSSPQRPAQLRLRWLALLLAGGPLVAIAEPADPAPAIADAEQQEVRIPDFMKKLLAGDYATLRQSLDDKNSSSKPATLQWTSPDDGKDSYAIGAALEIDLGEHDSELALFGSRYNTTTSFSPTVSYYRNSIIDKPKNTLQAGVVWNYGVRSFDDGSGGTDIWQQQFTTSLDYKDDRIKTGKGVQYGIAWAPVLVPGSLSPNRVREFGLLAAYWQPEFSLQGEHANGLDDESAGNVYRLKPNVIVKLYPWPGPLEQALSLQFEYSGWWNFAKSGPFDSYADYQKLFVAGLQLGLVKAPEDKNGNRADVLAVAVEYHHGANPEEGEEDQAYTQLVLKLRL